MADGGFKPVYELTAADLQAHPVWRYLVDDEGPEQADESWVGPQPSAPGQGDHGSFFISASFMLRNGQQLPGVVQLDMLGRFMTLEPVWIHANGKSVDLHEPDAARRLQRLLKMQDTQPLRWELSLPLRGETRLRSVRIVSSRLIRVAMLVVKLIRLRLLR